MANNPKGADTWTLQTDCEHATRQCWSVVETIKKAPTLETVRWFRQCYVHAMIETHQKTFLKTRKMLPEDLLTEYHALVQATVTLSQAFESRIFQHIGATFEGEALEHIRRIVQKLSVHMQELDWWAKTFEKMDDDDAADGSVYIATIESDSIYRDHTQDLGSKVEEFPIIEIPDDPPIQIHDSSAQPPPPPIDEFTAGEAVQPPPHRDDRWKNAPE